MRAKKILIDFLIPIAGEGGVERVLNTVSEYLNGNGFHVRIVQLISDGSRHFNPGIEVYPILMNEKVDDLSELATLYTAFLSQYGVPDIVVATSWPYLILTARRALSAFMVPCKVYSWLHGPLNEYARYGAGGIECMQLADHHLCISRHAADILVNDNPHVSTSIAYNPVDMSAYIPQLTYHTDSRTLLYVGRLSSEKRVDIILGGIAATNQNNPDMPWKLRIIGDGDERQSLLNITHELDIGDYVTFVGWQKNPWEHCGDITALVLSSDYEGSPLVAVEALANGIPVMSTPVDGITELIKPGINGWLFPHDDFAALAKLLELIAVGAMPAIDPAECVLSSAPYRRDIALYNFKSALYAGLDTISVIIPCYNVEKYIRRCLDSIIAQSISKARLEIICVDDCSTDNTLSILSEYEQQYPDIFMLIPLDRNMKQGYARNVALSYSSGDYITYVDADDCIESSMLEQLYLYSKIYNCDVVECGYSMFSDDTGLPPLTSEGTIRQYNMDRIDDKRSYVLNRYWKTGPCGRLYKRSLLIDNNIVFAENVRMEDILFSAMCMRYMHSYILLPDKYYNYYMNENGTMLGGSISQYFMNTASVQNMATDFLADCHWYDDCIEEYSYLHYTKAFEEPVWRMCLDSSLYSYENLTYLKDELLKRFPDICSNRYLTASDSDAASICRTILSNNLSKEALADVFLHTV